MWRCHPAPRACTLMLGQRPPHLHSCPVGYSGRYHAASLVAVFIALAIGILIGVGLADDVVSGASEEIEASLRDDLDVAEARIEQLEFQLEREQQFSFRAFPAVVSGRLAGSSVAIVGIGELPDETLADVEAALEPAGARVAAEAVIAVPADVEALVDAAGARYAAARRGGAPLTRLGNDLGSAMAGGGRLLESVSPELFSRFSGRLADVDRVVLVPSDLSELEAAEAAEAKALLDGIFAGVDAGSAGSVAVERSEADPTTLGQASDAGLATVDNADQLAGKAAIVLGLAGADGHYGVKEGADAFLPDLLGPEATSGGPAGGSGSGARQP